MVRGAAVFDAKRLIGRKFEEPSVQADAKLWPFKIENKGGKPVISVDYKGEKKVFMPEEVSSMVLIKMKEIAEAYLGACSASYDVFTSFKRVVSVREGAGWSLFRF